MYFDLSHASESSVLALQMLECVHVIELHVNALINITQQSNTAHDTCLVMILVMIA